MSLTVHETSSIVMQVVLVLILAWLMRRLTREMNDPRSPIEWWHLIASKGADGRNYATPTKVGMLLGSVAAFWIMLYVVLQVNWLEKPFEAVSLVTMCLAYLAGVEVYARHLKAKNGSGTQSDGGTK